MGLPPFNPLLVIISENEKCLLGIFSRPFLSFFFFLQNQVLEAQIAWICELFIALRRGVFVSLDPRFKFKGEYNSNSAELPTRQLHLFKMLKKQRHQPSTNRRTW